MPLACRCRAAPMSLPKPLQASPRARLMDSISGCLSHHRTHGESALGPAMGPLTMRRGPSAGLKRASRVMHRSCRAATAWASPLGRVPGLRCSREVDGRRAERASRLGGQSRSSGGHAYTAKPARSHKTPRATVHEEKLRIGYHASLCLGSTQGAMERTTRSTHAMPNPTYHRQSGQSAASTHLVQSENCQ